MISVVILGLMQLVKIAFGCRIQSMFLDLITNPSPKCSEVYGCHDISDVPDSEIATQFSLLDYEY